MPPDNSFTAAASLPVMLGPNLLKLIRFDPEDHGAGYVEGRL